MKSNDPKYKICWLAKKYCKDDISLIENYEAMMQDTTQRWVCHHKREIDENKYRELLIQENLYYNRPASELIFLTNSEHWSLHNLNMSDEQKLKISETMTHKPKSKEHKKNMREALNKPDTKKKKSEAMKCLKWFNNGVKQVRAKECPGPDFEPGRLK